MPVHHALPLWSRICSAAAPLATTTAATIEHALKQREIVQSMRSIEANEGQSEVFRFEDVIDNGAPLTLDDGSDDDSVNSSASLFDHLHRGHNVCFGQRR